MLVKWGWHKNGSRSEVWQVLASQASDHGFGNFEEIRLLNPSDCCGDSPHKHNEFPFDTLNDDPQSGNMDPIESVKDRAMVSDNRGSHVYQETGNTLAEFMMDCRIKNPEQLAPFVGCPEVCVHFELQQSLPNSHVSPAVGHWRTRFDGLGMETAGRCGDIEPCAGSDIAAPRTTEHSNWQRQGYSGMNAASFLDYFPFHIDEEIVDEVSTPQDG